MPVEPLQLRGRRGRRFRTVCAPPCRFLVSLVLECRHAQFIAEHLHRHGHVQGTVSGVCRDVYDLVAAAEIFVGQPRMLGSEDHGYPCFPGVLPERFSTCTRVDDRPRQPSQPRARTGHEPAVGNGLAHRIHDAGASQHVVRPDALAVASALGNSRGATSTSSSRPMVFMARALAPMLPGWDVSTRTMRTGICMVRPEWGFAVSQPVFYSSAAGLPARPRRSLCTQW